MTNTSKLVRQSAGSYRTADDRFEVRGQPGRWFLVDTEQADELGQELVRGPFATLDEVRAPITEARRVAIRPLPLPKARTAAGRRVSKPKPAAPPSWIDKLPSAEAKQVRALVRALEREGVDGAESLVQRDREGLAPEVARRLIERRLATLLEGVPEELRPAAADLARRAAAMLSVEGTRLPGELPGWVLVEIGPHPEPPNRRITLPD